MAKPKITMKKLLILLHKQPMIKGDIREILKIERKTEYRNCKEAEENGWIEKDELGRYHTTAL